MRLRIFWIAALFVSVGAALHAQQSGVDPAITEFLIEQESQFEEGDRVLKASLVAVIPSSKRLIVRTDGQDDPLALELGEDVRIRHRHRSVKYEDLKRDDVLVILLHGDNLQVKEIHKFER